MQPHPDFADVTLPRRIDLGDCHLTPLTAAQAEEDYDVVMSSAPVLEGIFAGWPEGLTLEGNRVELAWHDREFSLKRSFSWIIRDAAGSDYLGCLYLFPLLGEKGKAEGVIWFRDMSERVSIAQTITPKLQAWITHMIPSRVRVDWKVFPEVAS